MGTKRWRAMSRPLLPMVMRTMFWIGIDHHRRLEVLGRGLIDLDRPGGGGGINDRRKNRRPRGVPAGVDPEQPPEAEEKNPPYSRAAPMHPRAPALPLTDRPRSQIPPASPAKPGGRGNHLVATGANTGTEHQEYYSIQSKAIPAASFSGPACGGAPGKPGR